MQRKIIPVTPVAPHQDTAQEACENAEPFAREYWRCECDELGQDLLVYRDSGGWRLQGWDD